MNRFKQRMQEYDEVISSKTISKNFIQMAIKAKAGWESKITNFAIESNNIEGIYDDVQHMLAEGRLWAFLILDEVTVTDLCAFNSGHGDLRLLNQDVRVGNHIPPCGGAHIGYALEDILKDAMKAELTVASIHERFENLHPFTDGNGRTGRALWLWQMVNQEEYWIQNLFLQQWYYDSLDRSRAL